MDGGAFAGAVGPLLLYIAFPCLIPRYPALFAVANVAVLLQSWGNALYENIIQSKEGVQG